MQGKKKLRDFLLFQPRNMRGHFLALAETIITIQINPLKILPCASLKASGIESGTN